MKKLILTALLVMGFTLVFSCGGTPPAATETDPVTFVEEVDEVDEVEEVEEEAVEEVAE